MTLATLTPEVRGILRYSRWDALLLGLAVGHGALLILVPTFPGVALGLWWNSNTIAHYFIHKPFFRARALNLLFSVYLSVLLGIPQTLWRDRHLAHHAGVCWRRRFSRQMALEASLVLTLWTTLLALAPAFFLTVYLPGFVVGLALCSLHGYYEHVWGTTSHYGILYNLLFFNDGYHVEHHAHPHEHWTKLPQRLEAGALASRWPAVLRWLDLLSLETLERCVLRSRILQRFVLRCHERAFRVLLPQLPVPRRVGIVGGGLFPRTLLILQRLLPGASFVVIDRSAANLATARAFVGGHVRFVNAFYDTAALDDLDLVVIPLAFIGDRQGLYLHPPAPAVIIHDWIWRRRGTSALVSVLLLKRLNLVRP